MTQVTFKGNPIRIAGSLPETGSIAPDFKVVRTDLSPLSLVELKGKKVILNIFPSLDPTI